MTLLSLSACICSISEQITMRWETYKQTIKQAPVTILATTYNVIHATKHVARSSTVWFVDTNIHTDRERERERERDVHIENSTSFAISRLVVVNITEVTVNVIWSSVLKNKTSPTQHVYMWAVRWSAMKLQARETWQFTQQSKRLNVNCIDEILKCSSLCKI